MNAKPDQVVPHPGSLPPGESAYDPNNLHPLDEEARKNDPDDGVDYEEIIVSTQVDYLAGNYKEWKSEDYPTREAMMKAVEAYHEECFREYLCKGKR